MHMPETQAPCADTGLARRICGLLHRRHVQTLPTRAYRDRMLVRSLVRPQEQAQPVAYHSGIESAVEEGCRACVSRFVPAVTAQQR